MKIIIATIFITLMSVNCFSQKRINKLSLNGTDNFYSLNSNKGYNNNVVRQADGLCINFKTYDSAKASAMIYELMVNTTNAFYDNILSGNNLLNVENTFLSVNLIFPVMLFHRGNLEQTFSVGIGFSTLAARDFYNKSNDLLSYNTTTLKEISFGKYWTSGLLFDYEFNFKLYKKIGFNIGIRYSVASPINNSKIDYDASLGNCLAVKYGFHYQF